MTGLICAFVMAGCQQSPPAETASPFAEAFGFDPRTGDWGRHQFEELVQDCMAAQGFEYVPFIPDGPDVASTDLEDAETLGYGYAVSYQLDPPTVVEPINPNREIEEALPEAERRRYGVALRGEMATEKGQERPYETLGCVTQTQLQVYGFAGGFDGPFRALLDDLDSRVHSDPEYVEVLRSWSKCMAGKGYEFDSPDQALDAANQAVLDDFGVENDDAAFEVTESVSQSVIDAEIKQAVADRECQDNTRYPEIRQEVTLRLERETVDAHPDLLAQIKDLQDRW